jgi:hypothetical protein
MVADQGKPAREAIRVVCDALFFALGDHLSARAVGAFTTWLCYAQQGAATFIPNNRLLEWPMKQGCLTHES